MAPKVVKMVQNELKMVPNVYFDARLFTRYNFL